MALNQEKLAKEGQFEYLGRWVDKKHFRAFVYNEIEQRLATSYEEYHRLVGSGLWFASKELAISSKIKEEEKPLGLENKEQVQQKNDKKPLKSNRVR